MTMDGMPAKIVCWYVVRKSWWDLDEPEDPHLWFLPRVAVGRKR